MSPRNRQAPDVELIRFDNVTKIYGQGEAAVVALNRINLSIAKGEFVAVLGPSGSGKSTAMNILGCLDSPTSGHYYFQNVDLKSLTRDQLALVRRNYFGFVFQGYNLLKRTSALENLELPLIYRGTPKKERHELARRALALVGLSDRESHTAAELSGGQQQRVAIARALVTNPSVVFADEPTGSLDSLNGELVMKLLTTTARDQGTTVILVTHEPRVAAYADREVIVRDGKVTSVKRVRG